MRDDFSLDTIQRLAKRVGYLCSFPGCGSLTIGASQESDRATSLVGTACHISAASPGNGSRRYNPKLTPEERKSINNGIWMCNKHGKLIDTDENRFSTELLITWKSLAEEVATTMMEKGYDYPTALKLMQGKAPAVNQVSITQIGAENSQIGNLIFDSCLAIVWSKQIADAIRDYAIEHFRNAFIHGKATDFDIQIHDNKIIITDNGSEFNPNELLSNQPLTGGTISIQNLLTQFSDKIVFSSRRVADKNQVVISILKETNDIFAVTPCSVQLTFEDFHRGNSTITIAESCNEYYVVLPPYFALSDVMLMPKRFPQFDKKGVSLIFIVENTSGGVTEVLSRNYPNSRIIALE